jgi:hypothetical protein
MIVPGGGFVIDVLPNFAKNRALPFFLTTMTASFGLETNVKRSYVVYVRSNDSY